MWGTCRKVMKFLIACLCCSCHFDFFDHHSMQRPLLYPTRNEELRIAYTVGSARREKNHAIVAKLTHSFLEISSEMSELSCMWLNDTWPKRRDFDSAIFTVCFLFKSLCRFQGTFVYSRISKIAKWRCWKQTSVEVYEKKIQSITVVAVKGNPFQERL